MSVAIKVSSNLAEEARTAAADADRSLTGQVEHWARLGKALEPSLSSTVIAALKKSGGDLSTLEDEDTRLLVLQTLEVFRNAPRHDIAAQLNLSSKVRYEPDPENPGQFLRIHPDGTREKGSLKGRTFIAN